MSSFIRRSHPTPNLRLEPLEDRDVPVVFSNPASITIPDSGTGTPYPSTITVSGMPNQIASMTVSLSGLTHTWPDDIDILLVGPQGQRTILMSDAGGSADMNNVNMTFQQGGTPLTASGTIISGVYAPTDIAQGTDSFASPAPAGPYTASFLPFVGTNPNGVWSLFVVDDTGGDSGTIGGGWSMDIIPPPVVSSINRSSANPTNATSVSYAVTFNTSVSGVDASDFTLTTSGLTGASIASVSGSGTNYTVTVNSGIGQGTLALNLVDNDSIVGTTAPLVGVPLGLTGVNNGNFTGQVYTIDTVPPTVNSINRSSPTPKNASSVEFTVTFSEAVTGVNAADFTLDTTGGITGASIGSISNVGGAGLVWTVAVNTGTGDGTIRLNLVDDDSIRDGANNPLAGTGLGNGNFTGQVYEIDKTAPTVVGVVRADSSPTGASSVNFTVTFSEAVTGVGTSSFTLPVSVVAGAAITNVSGSGTTYTITVSTGTGDGTLGLNVKASGTGIVDTAGNALSGGFTGETYLIDKALPVVTGITRLDPTPTNAVTVRYQVTFSEAVTQVDASDFALVTNGVTGASVTNVSGSGTTFIVTVNTGSGSGTVGLNLVDDDSILDIANNPLAGVGTGTGNPGDGSVVGPVYEMDKDLPVVQGIVRTGSNPSAADAVDFNITFSEAVTGWDTNDFVVIATGVTGARVRSVARLDQTFRNYRVTVDTGTGDGTLRLDVIPTGIFDLSTNSLVGNFPSGQVYTIDKTPLVVNSITRLDASPTDASLVTYTVTFSDPVTGVDASDFSVPTNGISGASVTNVSGSGATYVVTVDTGTGDGFLRLDVKPSGTGITDSNGTALTGGFIGEMYAIQKTVVVPPPVVDLPPPPPASIIKPPLTTFATSVTAGSSNGTIVSIFDPATGQNTLTLVPFGGFRGELSVALGDLNGDGVADLVTGAGPGGGPHIKVFNGANGELLASFFGFGNGFTGGVTVAVGDIDGDGDGDLVVGAGSGGGPAVKVFDGSTFSEVKSFFAYNSRFIGGVNVAVGDVNNDGVDDIVTGTGAGGAPHVKAFSGKDLTELQSFMAYNMAYIGGVNVAVGDLNGDGYADIITGTGQGGTAHVKAFSGANGAVLQSFLAFDAKFLGGVSVGVADANRDGFYDIVVGAGPGGGPHVKVFGGLDMNPLFSGFARGTGIGGVSIS